MIQNKKTFKGFTLVELIIVITILVILGTIAFISFQNYTKDTRDSVRLVDIKQIYNGLDIERIKTEKTPLPEKYIEVTDGTKILTYQGYVGEKILRQIKINNGGQDPLTKGYYIYTTDPQNKKIQLMTYLETSDKEVKILGKLDVIMSTTNAITNSGYYQEKYIYVYGDKIGILTDKNKVPLQETTSSTGIDLTTNTQELITYFGGEVYENGQSTSTGIILINEINGEINNLTNNKYTVSGIITNGSGGTINACGINTNIDSSGNFSLSNVNYGTNCSSIKVIKNGYDCNILNDGPISLSSNVSDLTGSCTPGRCFSSTESINSHEYLIPTITHGTNTGGILSYDVNENDGIYKYKLENVSCYYGSFVNLIENSDPIIQSCGIDYYKNLDTCSQVGIGEYSPLGDINKYSCTLKPSNSVFTSRGSGEDNCNWACKLGYGGSNCDTLISVTITYSSSDSVGHNLYNDAKNSLYANPTWDGITPTTLNVIVSTGVVIGSLNTTTPAIIVPNSFPVGMIININNSGYIVGAGGSGGPGNDGNGYNGGNALNLLYAVNIINNGVIAGGGGGGGAGGRAGCPGGGRAGASGGGGGAGFNIGLGGVGGCDAGVACGTQGTSGSLSYGGGGGPINYGSCSGGYGGSGGKGGDLGQSGAHGGAGYSSNGGQGGGGNGGSAGYSIDGISYLTYTKSGTIFGPTK